MTIALVLQCSWAIQHHSWNGTITHTKKRASTTVYKTSPKFCHPGGLFSNAGSSQHTYQHPKANRRL